MFKFLTKKKKVGDTRPQIYPDDAFFPEESGAWINTEYGDNGPEVRELQIYLTNHDWCEFEKQPFFPALIEWVCHLENTDTQCIYEALHQH